MTPDLFLRLAIDPALSLLPERMTSDLARAMLLATALQESGLRDRKQIGGGAKGFHQWEPPPGRVAMVGLLDHNGARPHVLDLCVRLVYQPIPERLHAAVEHNDFLDCGLARLLLWTVPRPLPLRSDVQGAWSYYVDAWRPGRPRPETWADHYARAWEAVEPLPEGATT